MKLKTTINLLILISILLLPPAAFGFTEPSNSQYSCQPIFQVNAVPPNILIIMDNSGSMNSRAYSGNYDHNTRYYGYFEPYVKYSYASNIFTRNTSGGWDGNLLNWAVMRRIDLARKVLMGGLATSRTGGGNQVNLGEAVSYPYNVLTWQTDVWGVTPWPGEVFAFWPVDNGNFVFYHDSSGVGSNWVLTGSFTIKVQKDSTQADEAANFVDGNIAGVLQKVGEKARWGNEWFNYGTGANQSGGRVVNTISSGSVTSMVTDLQNTPADTWTPLGESYYTAVQYYKQQSPDTSLDYKTTHVPCANIGDDPYYNGSEYVPCAKSFVILITDGASTMDGKIPAALRDYADSFDTFVGANDGVACTESTGSGCEYGSSGTDYLKDVALYARTTDLRSSSVGKTELSGEQNMMLYNIFAAFGQTDANAENLLKEAAKNGGFIEKDGTFGPTSTAEWDSNSDGLPDTYYKADNGYELEAKLLQAINDILERAASGTAVSVLATSGEGEGSLVQAFFRPLVTSGLTEIKWLGYLQCLWVDSLGNLREDTNANRTLEIGTDKVVTHFVDTSTGDTRIKRFAVSSADPYPDVENDAYETVELDEIMAVWQAEKRLAERSAADRKIFTYIDKDNDDIVDETVANPFDDSAADLTSNEVIRFHTGSAAAITPYLGVQDNSTWAYLAGSSTNTQANRVTNLIQYIRGTEIPGLRTRTFDYDSDGTNETWKLGDIVHSTPVTVARPPENFHILYADQSYKVFYNAFKDRETVVYVGANDGMLHAFTSWKYDSTNKKFDDPYPSDSSGDSTYISNEAIGDELWAFIPQSLLPHLKWLPSTNYSHVYYVDMKPKVFDAQILPLNTHYTDSTGASKNWGTFLLVGFNLGGGFVQAKEDFDYDGSNADTGSLRDFYPSYALLDVTEPRNPRLMWERSYAGLQASSSTPAVIKVKNKWFAVFGSGPSDCNGGSAQPGKVYIVDLATGNPYPDSSGNDWRFQTADTKAFMNSPVSLDKDLNFNVDAIYFGQTWLSGTSNWKGKVYKITIPWKDASGNYDGTNLTNISDDPSATSLKPWLFSELFDATRPVTAPLSLSVDALDNAWIYGGTGRYLNDADKTNTDTQYFFGLKDPFFNSNYQTTSPAYYHSYSSTKSLTQSNLLNADGIIITDAGLVFQNGNPYPIGTSGTFQELLTTARGKDGWLRSMTGGERILTKPTLLGGTVFVTSFVPSDDTCGFGGNSYLWGVYFETGSAYYKGVFSKDPTATYTDSSGGTHEQVVDKISLGAGKSSSLGVHVGAEEGAKGFIQQSTGTIVSESLNPALKFKSGLTSWKEK